MFYHDIFVSQKKAEGVYNQASDDLAKEIMEDYQDYVVKLAQRQNNKNPHLFSGLVVGYVQSGKTMNFCHLINRAIDDGFQLIVILSSNKNDLNMQTTDRIAEDVIGFCNPAVPQIKQLDHHKKGLDFVSFHRNKSDVGIAISSAVNPNITGNYPYGGVDINLRSPQVYWLTACDKGNPLQRNVDFSINDGGGSETFDDYYAYDPQGCFVTVIKKNNARLKLLYQFLANSQRVKMHEVKALFIDDECDEITVSGLGRHLAKTSVTIDQIQQLFRTTVNDKRHSMYVEYTATPVANICVKNRPNTNTGFPDDFIKLMKKADAYCGFQEYFKYQDVVMDISPVQADDEMVPFGMGNAAWWTYRIQSPILYKALLQYVLNCRIFDERFSGEKTTSMLVHTAREKDEHKEEWEYVEELLDALSLELLDELDDIHTNGAGNYVHGMGHDLMDDLYGRFEDIVKKMYVSDQKGYYQQAPFGGCSLNAAPNNGQGFDVYFAASLLQYMLRQKPAKSYHPNLKYSISNGKKIEVLEVNSDSKSTLPKNRNFIAVGGNKLSRGLTLQNLSVTYFSRETGAIDTYTQMARWFGYRIGYFDLCRLFMDDTRDVQQAHNVEKELHRQIRIQNRKKIKPGNMHLILDNTAPKELSGKQALRIVKMNPGQEMETVNFYSVRGVATNQRVIEGFFDKLKGNGNLPETMGNYGYLSVIPGTTPNASRYCYVADVPVDYVYGLLSGMVSVSNKNEFDMLMLAENYMRKNGAQKCNVLLSGRTANASTAPRTVFGGGTYSVCGKAVKQKAVLKGMTYYEVNPFSDCAEDYVVDYPSPGKLNADFTQFVGGQTYTSNRDSNYVSKVKVFGAVNRDVPLIIITPFVFSANAAPGLNQNTVYYSIHVLFPGNYRVIDFNII